MGHLLDGSMVGCFGNSGRQVQANKFELLVAEVIPNCFMVSMDSLGSDFISRGKLIILFQLTKKQTKKFLMGIILQFLTWHSCEIDGETVETVVDFIVGGSKITADGDCSQKMTLALWKKNYGQPRQLIKRQSRYFANKGPSSQSCSFSSSHVWM